MIISITVAMDKKGVIGFRYSHQQGLSSRELTIEEMFEPASLALTE